MQILFNRFENRTCSTFARLEFMFNILMKNKQSFQIQSEITRKHPPVFSHHPANFLIGNQVNSEQVGRLEGPSTFISPFTFWAAYFWPYSTIWANLFDTETPRRCQYWFRIGDIVSFSRSNYLLLKFNEFDLLFWREGLSIIQASKETFLNAFLIFSIK